MSIPTTKQRNAFPRSFFSPPPPTWMAKNGQPARNWPPRPAATTTPSA